MHNFGGVQAGHIFSHSMDILIPRYRTDKTQSNDFVNIDHKDFLLNRFCQQYVKSSSHFRSRNYLYIPEKNRNKIIKYAIDCKECLIKCNIKS